MMGFVEPAIGHVICQSQSDFRGGPGGIGHEGGTQARQPVCLLERGGKGKRRIGEELHGA